MTHAGRLHVVWDGDFGGSGSIAYVNRELCRRLASRVALSIAPREGDTLEPSLAPFVGRRLPRVDVVVRHRSSPTSVPPRVGRWVWMTPWEYGASLPVEWLSPMRRGDAMAWVYSEWTRQQFVANGIDAGRVAVVPLGVDPACFHPDVPPLPMPPPLRIDQTCRFLFVGRLVHRKGIDLILRAYRQAFSSRDDAVLVIKPCEMRGVDGSAMVREIETAFADAAAPRVTILPADLQAAQLPALYTACACGALVHPYRGESFCLPIAEAMACGVPVITTDRGGASACATADTATLLPSSLVHRPTLILGRRRLSNFPHWQEVSVDTLSTAMRRFYDDPTPARQRATHAREWIATRFQWDQAAEAALQALEAAMSDRRDDHDDHADDRANDVTRQRQRREAWLDEGDAQFNAGALDTAAAAYHRCTSRDAMLADWSDGQDIAPRALRGLGRVAQARGLQREASRFSRFATRLSRASAARVR